MSKLAKRTLRSVALAGVAALAATAHAAYAATTTSSLSVDATVTANCSVTTTSVSFGNVNVLSGTNVDATGGISVTCTNGTAWAASANAGGGSGATISDRKMTSGANVLDYDLYTDSARTTIWGDGTTGNGSTISGTGSGSAQASTIYGRVPSGQTSKPAGSYADTVTVTVTY